MSLKVVDLNKRREQIDLEVQEKMIEQLEMLKKAVTDGRLLQLALKFQTQNEVNREDSDTYMLFWNNEFDFDKIVGFVDRFKQQLMYTADAVEQGEE